jgi:hypothetical protein
VGGGNRALIYSLFYPGTFQIFPEIFRYEFIIALIEFQILVLVEIIPYFRSMFAGHPALSE